MAPKKVKQAQGKKTTKDIKSKSKQEKGDKSAETSSDLWQLKLKRTKQDLEYYQKAHHNMVRENEQLRSFLYKAEISNVGTTDYWQKEFKDRDEKIKILEEQIKRQEELAVTKKLQWEDERNQNFKLFKEDILKRKATEARIKKKIADFRKQMHTSKEEYRENIRKKDEQYALIEKQLEREWKHRYNEREVIQLKHGYEKTIAELQSNLKYVQEEKNCISGSLTNALAQVEDLSQLVHSLSRDKLALAVDKNILMSTLKKNIGEMALQEKMLTEVTAKASFLEKALNKTEKEKGENEKRSQVIIQASEVELDKLQKIIAMREKEIYRVKQLARTIVEKRKDMEVFFHEALDHVRQEIADNIKRCKKEACQDYHQKFREGIEGKTKLPLIQTFHQNPNSTNSFYSAMKAAEKWPHSPSKEVYMSDLTWEQKEKVLTLLFAKMNGEAVSVTNKKTHLYKS